jgi:hypothetical protein
MTNDDWYSERASNYSRQRDVLLHQRHRYIRSKSSQHECDARQSYRIEIHASEHRLERSDTPHSRFEHPARKTKDDYFMAAGLKASR